MFTHILIVDDDKIMQKLLRDYLQPLGYNLTFASDCYQSTKYLESEKIDCVILDVILPDQSGLQHLRWIKEVYCDMPVLLLSRKKTEEDRIAGLEAGADDYLTKPFSLRELELRINKLMQRCRRSWYTIQKGVAPNHENSMFVDPDQECFIKNGKPIRLTHFETQILQYFFNKIGKTITRNELTISLEGKEHNPLDRRLDVHINRLRKKIEDNPSRPVILKTIWGKGYRLTV
jgi:DNA-binding response OmpR family regulator